MLLFALVEIHWRLHANRCFPDMSVSITLTKLAMIHNLERCYRKKRPQAIDDASGPAASAPSHIEQTEATKGADNKDMPSSTHVPNQPNI